MSVVYLSGWLGFCVVFGLVMFSFVNIGRVKLLKKTLGDFNF